MIRPRQLWHLFGYPHGIRLGSSFRSKVMIKSTYFLSPKELDVAHLIFIHHSEYLGNPLLRRVFIFREFYHGTNLDHEDLASFPKAANPNWLSTIL